MRPTNVKSILVRAGLSGLIQVSGGGNVQVSEVVFFNQVSRHPEVLYRGLGFAFRNGLERMQRRIGQDDLDGWVFRANGFNCGVSVHERDLSASHVGQARDQGMAVAHQNDIGEI